MRKPVRILVCTSLGVVAVVASACYGVWHATQQTPEFYQSEMKKDLVKLVAAGEAMEQQVIELHNEVRRPGRWEATFTNEQINGWLAVDLPDKFPRALPKGVTEPRVAIQEEEAVVACRYQNPKLTTIFSMGVEVSLTEEPNVVAVRIRKARAGLMPIPLSKLLEHATKYAHKSDVTLRWVQVEGDPVALITVPAEHEEFVHHRIRIETIDLREGAVYLAGRTEDSELTAPPAYQHAAALTEKQNVQR